MDQESTKSTKSNRFLLCAPKSQSQCKGKLPWISGTEDWRQMQRSEGQASLKCVYFIWVVFNTPERCFWVKNVMEHRKRASKLQHAGICGPKCCPGVQSPTELSSSGQQRGKWVWLCKPFTPASGRQGYLNPLGFWEELGWNNDPWNLKQALWLLVDARGKGKICNKLHLEFHCSFYWLRSPLAPSISTDE